jgi:hypothetical protein
VGGFAVVPGIVDDAKCDVIASHLQAFERIGAGTRTLLGQAWCVELAGDLRRAPDYKQSVLHDPIVDKLVAGLVRSVFIQGEVIVFAAVLGEDDPLPCYLVVALSLFEWLSHHALR